MTTNLKNEAAPAGTPELQQLSRTQRLEAMGVLQLEIEQHESQLIAVRNALLETERSIDEGNIIAMFVPARRAQSKQLKADLEVLRATEAELVSTIAGLRARVDGHRTELERNDRLKADQAQWKLCTRAAELVQAAVKLVDLFSELPDADRRIEYWSLALHKSDQARFAAAIAGGVLREMLAGTSDFLACQIRALPGELITPEMKKHLGDVQSEADKQHHVRQKAASIDPRKACAKKLEQVMAFNNAMFTNRGFIKPDEAA